MRFPSPGIKPLFIKIFCILDLDMNLNNFCYKILRILRSMTLYYQVEIWESKSPILLKDFCGFQKKWIHLKKHFAENAFFKYLCISIACLHEQNKKCFLEVQLFSSQPIRVFVYFLNCFDWLDKSRPSIKATFVLFM